MGQGKISISGLSGNEIYCLKRLGYSPGELLVGNSVFSVGLLGSISAGFRGLVGGEITEYTNVISEGRHLAFQRLEKELSEHRGVGATGVTSELIFHIGNVEFLSIASSLHSESNQKPFTTSVSGQELYCQIDAHYKPIKFVFGNVAYSIGMGRGIMGSLKTLVRGEVKDFSEIFNITRHRALERITAEARAVGANSVVGIQTSIIPFGTIGVQEMAMIGTAAHNPHLSQTSSEIVSSDLTSEEVWGLAEIGLAPQSLLLHTSVYSLGLMGGIASFFKGFVRGEISNLTTLIYEARENALDGLRRQAQAINAEQVVGTQTHIYHLGGGLIEFLAIGTAVRKIDALAKPNHDSLPAQAIIRDRNTFINTSRAEYATNLSSPEN